VRKLFPNMTDVWKFFALMFILVISVVIILVIPRGKPDMKDLSNPNLKNCPTAAMNPQNCASLISCQNKKKEVVDCPLGLYYSSGE
jgi:hypothetical protein